MGRKLNDHVQQSIHYAFMSENDTACYKSGIVLFCYKNM